MEYTGKDLLRADLVVDALYKGYRTDKGGMADPLVGLVGVSRQGGFRYRGSRQSPTLLVLTSNLAEVDWPDELDETTGRFVYYGDNRQPGRQLHDTPRFGNQLLKTVFDLTHGGHRDQVPPILIFTSEGPGRCFRFRGLAVPGYPSLPGTQDLVAIWKTVGNERFQNYRAEFTILDAAMIDRDWVHAMATGTSGGTPPEAWMRWVKAGVAEPLVAPRAKLVRSRLEQLPSSKEDDALINVIRDRYKGNEFAFEACAGELAKLVLRNISRLDLTRPWRDGGRDAIGTLAIGRGPASIDIQFALEAKCYAPTNSVGVKEMSRLISRIKHREFGVLVTTSFVSDQAYKEIVEDGHPVIVIVARDIVAQLRSSGYGTTRQVKAWLDAIDSARD